MKTKHTRTNVTDEPLIARTQHDDTQHAEDEDAVDHETAVRELREALVEQIGQLRETYAGLDSYALVESLPLLTAALHLLDDVEATVQAELDPEDDADSHD